MKNAVRKLGAACGVVLIGGLTLAGPAYASDSRSGGGFACGPDDFVRLSTAINVSGTTNLYWRITGASSDNSWSWSSGTTHYYNTGVRSISSWRATTNKTFTGAGPSCF